MIKKAIRFVRYADAEKAGANIAPSSLKFYSSRLADEYEASQEKMEFVMSRSLLIAAVIALSASLAGCASASHQAGLETVSKCGLDSHTVAYPNSPDPEKAYACRSDNVGYLGGSADNHEGMVPQ
jgi:hypothetical protein